MGSVNGVVAKEMVQLLVRTGIQMGKGTYSNICVVLYDKLGRKTNIKELDCSFRDDFESGHIDNLPVDLRRHHN